MINKSLRCCAAKRHAAVQRTTSSCATPLLRCAVKELLRSEVLRRKAAKKNARAFVLYTVKCEAPRWYRDLQDSELHSQLADAQAVGNSLEFFRRRSQPGVCIMTRTTIKQLEDAFKAEAHITGRLTARINELVERLDKASDFCKQLNTHIVALEEQNDKTRKQLWYLQKVAKGEFEPQTPKKPDQPVQEVHEDVPNQAF